MKITKISLYHYDWLPDELEGLALSKGRKFTGYPGRVIKIETDEGIVGWGEDVPHGTRYTEAFAGGIQPGLDLIVPELIGMDPTNVEEIYHKMDSILLGQNYVKDGIDTACWDIFGKFTGKPLYELWGGQQVEKVPAVAFLPRDFEKYEKEILDYLQVCRDRGYTMFQTKAAYGVEWAMRYIEFMEGHLKDHETLWFDCNRGYSLDDAIRICRRARNINFYIEQPCETYQECRDVMRYTGVPVILDECIVKMSDLARAAIEGGIGGLNLKIGRVGGPTKAKQMRDFCNSMRIPVYPMTTNSSQIGDAVLLNLGMSTPEYILRYTCCASDLSASVTAEGLPFEENAFVPTGKPGLGIEVLEDQLELLQTWE